MYESNGSMDDLQNGSEAQMLSITCSIRETYTTCEGQPTQLPCTNRMRYNLLFPWSREEVVLEKVVLENL